MRVTPHSTLLSDLQAIEQRIVFYDQPAAPDEPAFVMLPGTQPILISAPHSTRHWRGNNWKQEEEYTAALAYMLHQQTGAHVIYGRYLLNPDPHDDQDSGPYKQAIADILRTTPIRLALDLHGARGDRDFAIALGTILGETFKAYETTLLATFERFGFSSDPETSLDRIALNPPRYTGGLLQPTITRYLWRQHGIPTAQIELSAWLRIVRRLPNASNAQSGIAPHFRGDGVRIIRLYEALQSFIADALMQS